jgi:hypothetical protein
VFFLKFWQNQNHDTDEPMPDSQPYFTPPQIRGYDKLPGIEVGGPALTPINTNPDLDDRSETLPRTSPADDEEEPLNTQTAVPQPLEKRGLLLSRFSDRLNPETMALKSISQASGIRRRARKPPKSKEFVHDSDSDDEEAAEAVMKKQKGLAKNPVGGLGHTLIGDKYGDFEE